MVSVIENPNKNTVFVSPQFDIVTPLTVNGNTELFAAIDKQQFLWERKRVITSGCGSCGNKTVTVEYDVFARICNEDGSYETLPAIITLRGSDYTFAEETEIRIPVIRASLAERRAMLDINPRIPSFYRTDKENQAWITGRMDR